MNPKIIKIVAVVILGIIVIIAGIYFIQSKKTVSPISSKPVQIQKIAVDKEPSKTLKDYLDESGFSFKYPDDIDISKQDSSDTITYADLILTSKTAIGQIEIKVQDTKANSLKDWIMESKDLSSLESKAIKLGSLDASEIASIDKIVAVAVDQKIVFIIDVSREKDKNYWKSVYDSILSSFAFSNPQSSSVSQTQDAGVSDDVIDEGEEIVE